MIGQSAHRQGQSEATRKSLRLRSPRMRRFNSRGYLRLRTPPPECLMSS